MKVVFTILLSLTILAVSGQTKKVEFYGYALMQYQSPVLIGDGNYSAYYKRMGEIFSNGRFELNESRGTFLIKWENGDDWLAQYSKKITTTNQQDLEIGEVTQINYVGKWIDNYDECELRVLQTKNNKCVIELRTGKVIDTDKGINAWKKVFRFYTRDCLDGLLMSEHLENKSSESNNKKEYISFSYGEEYLTKAFVTNPKSVAWKVSEYKTDPNNLNAKYKKVESSIYLIFDNKKIYMLVNNKIEAVWNVIKKYFDEEYQIIKTKEGYTFSQFGNIIITYPNRSAIEYDGHNVPIKEAGIDKKNIR